MPETARTDTTNADTDLLGAAQKAALRRMKEAQSFEPALSSLFTLKNLPLSIDDYPMMKPMYSFTPPAYEVWMCGRQVSKTTSIAARGLCYSIYIPFFNSLFLQPAERAAKRFSNNHLRPFIYRSSELRSYLENTSGVFQKNFTNGSLLHLSYASDDPDRIRGISADITFVDECQLFDPDFFPVIARCMDASKYEIAVFTGTASTEDNFIDLLWNKSCQYEWAIPCSCGHYNIPTLDADLTGMLQKRGLSCAKCGKLLDTFSGEFQPQRPDRVDEFAGWHIPQAVVPLHCNSARKWKRLMEAYEEEAPRRFYQERMGITFDVGSKPITRSELVRACTLSVDTTNLDAVKAERFKSQHAILGVDWSGRGDLTSSTTAQALIVLEHGRFHVLYGERVPLHATIEDEAKRVAWLKRTMGCELLAHDFAEAGILREDYLKQVADMGPNELFSFRYTRAEPGRALLVVHPPTNTRPGYYYSADKTRAVSYILRLIKNGYILFPDWSKIEPLLQDFLSLREESHYTPSRGDTYIMARNPKVPDDFVHAVVTGVLALCRVTGYWPDLRGEAEAIAPTHG